MLYMSRSSHSQNASHRFFLSLSDSLFSPVPEVSAPSVPSWVSSWGSLESVKSVLLAPSSASLEEEVSLSETNNEAHTDAIFWRTMKFKSTSCSQDQTALNTKKLVHVDLPMGVVKLYRKRNY